MLAADLLTQRVIRKVTVAPQLSYLAASLQAPVPIFRLHDILLDALPVLVQLSSSSTRPVPSLSDLLVALPPLSRYCLSPLSTPHLLVAVNA